MWPLVRDGHSWMKGPTFALLGHSNGCQGKSCYDILCIEIKIWIFENARTSTSHPIRPGALQTYVVERCRMNNLPESAKARKQVRSALTATEASVDLIARWGKLWRLMHASKYLFNPHQSSLWSATQWLSNMGRCLESLRFLSFHDVHCVGPTDIPLYHTVHHTVPFCTPGGSWHSLLAWLRYQCAAHCWHKAQQWLRPSDAFQLCRINASFEQLKWDADQTGQRNHIEKNKNL